MANCKACNKSVHALAMRVGGLCGACYAEEEARTRLERLRLPIELAKRYAGFAHPDLAAVGSWNVVNRQTLTKNMGQALLSGAIGLPAPFLVKGADYVGRIGLVAVCGDEFVFVDLGHASLHGVGSESASVDEGQLRALLQSPADEAKSTRVSCSELQADYSGSDLNLKGAFQLVLCLPAVQAVDGIATAKSMAYAISGAAHFPAPASLLDGLLKGGEKPDAAVFRKMAVNAYYMKELFRALQRLNRDKRGKLLAQLYQIPEDVPSLVSDLISQRSKGAERRPVVSITVLAAGLLGVCFFLAALISVLVYNARRTAGDTSFSSIADGPIVIGILGALLAAIGAIGLRIHSTKRWYRSQLASPLCQESAQHRRRV